MEALTGDGPDMDRHRQSNRGNHVDVRSQQSTVPGWVPGALVGLATLLIAVAVSGLIDGRSAGWREWFRLPSLFEVTTPTGGDLGAHVLLPTMLKENLGQFHSILGWSNAWFAGFPTFYFYFPLPSLTIVALDVLLPYGVAFKLVTISGLLALPSVSYLLVRWLGLPKLVAGVAAVSGGMFVFMSDYWAFGANIKSTLVGEFSFSWSFALALLYLGRVTLDVREDRSFEPLPAIFLALAAVSHVLPVIAVVVASVPLLFRRDGVRIVISSWLLGFGLSSVWALPFGVSVLRGFSTDINWELATPLFGQESLLPLAFLPVVVLGLAGIVWTLRRRADVWVLLAITLIPAVAYVVVPTLGLNLVHSGRWLPFWYYGMYIFAGIAIAWTALWLSARSGRMSVRLPIGLTVGVGMLILGTLISAGDVPARASFYFSGYEEMPRHEELRTLMEEVDKLPPGRVMWEENKDMGQYGTPIALMLLPYWSPGHPSMAGIVYESSLSSPFVFLLGSEVSQEPISTFANLPYGPMDFERGVAHMELYGVTYYVSFTTEAERAAVDAGLRRVAEADPWVVFALPTTKLVEVATAPPSVWAGEESFTGSALEWFDDTDKLDRWLTESGPASWLRVESLDERQADASDSDVTNAVRNVLIEDERISFETSAIGVPHLVKVSYFPNWKAVGADGPYLAAPSLMVVVPTEETVVLEFRQTWVEYAGFALTVVSILFLVIWGWRTYRRPSRAEVDEPRA